MWLSFFRSFCLLSSSGAGAKELLRVRASARCRNTMKRRAQVPDIIRMLLSAIFSLFQAAVQLSFRPAAAKSAFSSFAALQAFRHYYYYMQRQLPYCCAFLLLSSPSPSPPVTRSPSRVRRAFATVYYHCQRAMRAIMPRHDVAFSSHAFLLPMPMTMFSFQDAAVTFPFSSALGNGCRKSLLSLFCLFASLSPCFVSFT